MLRARVSPLVSGRQDRGAAGRRADPTGTAARPKHVRGATVAGPPGSREAAGVVPARRSFSCGALGPRHALQLEASRVPIDLVARRRTGPAGSQGGSSGCSGSAGFTIRGGRIGLSRVHEVMHLCSSDILEGSPPNPSTANATLTASPARSTRINSGQSSLDQTQGYWFESNRGPELLVRGVVVSLPSLRPRLNPRSSL